VDVLLYPRKFALRLRFAGIAIDSHAVAPVLVFGDSATHISGADERL
jgi:hypothetical protein